MIPTVSTRIHLLRRRQKRTLKDVATQCGFTESLLSKIEAGKTSPPIATLSRIATALGVALGDLLTDTPSDAPVMTQASVLRERSPTHTANGYGFHMLAAGTGKLMQPFLFVAEKGKVAPSPLSHGGEEFIYVIEGRMRYQVGAVNYTLGPGDTLYFDSEANHSIEPLTKTVRYLGVFAERPDAIAKPEAKAHSKRTKIK